MNKTDNDKSEFVECALSKDELDTVTGGAGGKVQFQDFHFTKR